MRIKRIAAKDPHNHNNILPTVKGTPFLPTVIFTCVGDHNWILPGFILFNLFNFTKTVKNLFTKGYFHKWLQNEQQDRPYNCLQKQKNIEICNKQCTRSKARMRRRCLRFFPIMPLLICTMCNAHVNKLCDSPSDLGNVHTTYEATKIRPEWRAARVSRMRCSLFSSARHNSSSHS